MVDAPGHRLRPETPDDLAFLQRLYVWLHWEDLGALSWTSEHKTAYLAAQFGQHMAHLAENHADGDFQIITLRDAPAGRFYTHAVPSEIRLLALDLLPDARGLGIGGTLLAELAALGRTTNRKIVARVEAGSPALSWFQRRGFRQFTRLGHSCGLELPPDKGY